MMKIISPADHGKINILKGVSTLDFINMRIVLLFLIMIVAFGDPIYAGHSILDRVDPAFDLQVESNSYSGKFIHQLKALPDGKVLAFGNFNSYDRQPTGNLVRLNADGSLDTSFNNKTITSVGGCDPRTKIIVQPDGKIILACSSMVANGQAPKHLLRLNADGTLDTNFNYTFSSAVSGNALDSQGRLAIVGGFQTPQGFRNLIRLNPDGSYDSSFNFTINISTYFIETQGSRVIVGNARVMRLNENGSEDTSFALSNTSGGVSQLITQPDNKILYQNDTGLYRINQNGGSDTGFQTSTLSQGAVRMELASDGKIVIWKGNNLAATFYRFLPNGVDDPSLAQYTHPAFAACFTIQPDGGLILGDYYNFNSTQGINNFIRLAPGGSVDPAFNPGGVAFQTMLPGSIRSIVPLPDGKVLLGGKFDVINEITRPKIVRLNADSSVDTSFQLNTSTTGNYFSPIIDVYHISVQSDGKIVVSGWFNYVQNGVAKKNLVRLNSDGSIDTTFDLTQTIDDWSEIVGAGRTPVISLSDGKLLVGNSRLNGFGPVGPLKFNQDGSRDTSFTSMLNSTSQQMYIDDIELQPDGKILVSGSQDPGTSGLKSFVARLNADGSLDPSFSYTEEAGRLKSTLALLPNGKILIGKHSNGTGPAVVKQLNSDGSPDASFNTLSIPGGIVNALLVLPNGKIFVGGRFTITINGQQGKNLLQLGADGIFESTIYNLDNEVLSLALDGEGRLLVGGSFTVIDANGAGATRSFVARLTDSRTRFDFDGDGKDDVSVFRSSEGNWYLSQSRNGYSQQNFGIASDLLTPGDFDGDGKTDLAIFRPGTGTWWYKSSINHAFYAVVFGSDGDIPLAEDFNGDGRADFVVFRPSTSTWYRLASNGQYAPLVFGTTGDIPLVADMDGDGKADPTIYRPSTGTWWYASSSNGLFYAIQWGTATDIPVPGDYDGDGKTDPAYFRPSTGVWYIVYSGTGYATFLVTSWGTGGDRPTAGDYDGDGKTDLAIYRPSNGMWFAMRSTSGFFSQQFGLVGDKAVPNAFVP